MNSGLRFSYFARLSLVLRRLLSWQRFCEFPHGRCRTFGTTDLLSQLNVNIVSAWPISCLVLCRVHLLHWFFFRSHSDSLQGSFTLCPRQISHPLQFIFAHSFLFRLFSFTKEITIRIWNEYANYRRVGSIWRSHAHCDLLYFVLVHWQKQYSLTQSRYGTCCNCLLAQIQIKIDN